MLLLSYVKVVPYLVVPEAGAGAGAGQVFHANLLTGSAHVCVLVVVVLLLLFVYAALAVLTSRFHISACTCA
jgi:hypothetical protein